MRKIGCVARRGGEHRLPVAPAQGSRETLACVPTHRSAEPVSLVVRVGFADSAELLAAVPDVYYLTKQYLNYTSVAVRISRVSPGIC